MLYYYYYKCFLGVELGMVDIQELYTTSSGYYSESAKIFVSHDTKYYDEIITKPHIQTREEYERTSQYWLDQKLQQEELQKELHNQTRRKKRILLVDDEPDVCMVYQIVLEDAGYQCISYTDPIKALQEFRPKYYDLILLDIKMPILNGFELCKKIIELDRTVHIVFITASEEYYEKFRSQHFPELGKINYIQKPVSNDELVRIVNTILTNSITID
jgi:CheY-like chemotaxis protein